MPKKIKIIKEIEEESLEKTPEIPKEKKPRTEKQIQAFKNMIEKKNQKVKTIEEEVPEVPKKKRGRPTLTEEKIQEKKIMKEEQLEKQLKKLEMKIELTAKKEAKKKIIDKIKSKMMEDEDEQDESDTDEEIQEIIKKQKKPIIIVNKIQKEVAKPKPVRANNELGPYFI